MCTPCARQIPLKMPLFLKLFSPSARTRLHGREDADHQIQPLSNRYIRGKLLVPSFFGVLRSDGHDDDEREQFHAWKGHETGGSFHVVARRTAHSRSEPCAPRHTRMWRSPRTSAISEYEHSRCLRLSLTWRVTPHAVKALDYTIHEKMSRGYIGTDKVSSDQSLRRHANSVGL